MRVVFLVCLLALSVQAYPDGRARLTNYDNRPRPGAVKKLSMGGIFTLASIIKNIIGIVMGGKKFNEDWFGDNPGRTEKAPHNKAVNKLSLMSTIFNLASDGKKFNEDWFGETFSYAELLRDCEGSVLYAPATAFTDRLMDVVGARLHLKRLNHLPRENETGYFSLSNESSLAILKYSKDMSSDDAVVIFDDMESDSWSEKLKYTIRMKTDFWRNNEYIPILPFDLDHHEDFGMQSQSFIRVQWAIDISYLHLVTGADVEPSLTLQVLPFSAEYTNFRVYIAGIVSAYILPLALDLPFIHLVQRLFEGKNTGMHELIKMEGVSWEALSASYVLDMVPVMVVHAAGTVLFCKVAGYVPNTNGGFIFAVVALHDLTWFTLALLTVYLFNITQFIPLLGFVEIYGLWSVGLFVLDTDSRVFSLLTEFIPHTAFMRFWFTLGAREGRGDGITISNMSSVNSLENEKTTVTEHLVCMALQSIIFYMVAWYLSRVRPGRYGHALPWGFPFMKQYWRKQPQVEVEARSDFKSEGDRRYFEKAPSSLPVGIKIIDIYKSFGNERVLHGVNLVVYRDEITVMLGRNDAGKTTLINIITGLTSASSGRVLVEGKDTFLQANEVRKLIGLCPQQNVLFSDLTVFEHLRFFAMLKGQTCPQSRTSATELISRLQLSDNADNMVTVLSGGMCRRLQLACAVVSGAKVLVLDEPTSGLDVESRRELWNLLLSLRRGRTMLLSTHFMEEAEALGDRIAALQHGRVKCHATSMFLKRAIGTGYRLSFTTAGAPKGPEITAAITAIVPDATVRDKRPNAVSYNLPAKDSARFPALFAALEERRSELCIATIGVGKSTLDDVFLELCSDGKPCYTGVMDATIVEPVHKKVTGAKLYARQFAVLLLRQWHYITSNLYTLIAGLIVITLILWGVTAETNNNKRLSANQNKPLARFVFNQHAASPYRLALVNVDKDSLESLRSSFSGVHFKEVSDVAAAALRTSREVQMYSMCIFGIELNETDAKVVYSPTERHCAPVALNVLSNAVARRAFNSIDSTVTRDRPLQGAFVSDEAEVSLAKDSVKIRTWVVDVALVFFFALAAAVMLPSEDTTTGARHAHVMAGAPRALHWAATLTAQLMVHLLLCGLPLVVLAAAADNDATINQSGFLLALCVLVILASLAFLGQTYLHCLLFSQRTVIAWVMISTYIYTKGTPFIPESSAWYPIAFLILLMVPQHAFTAGLMRAAVAAQANAHCTLNRHKCPILFGPGVFDAWICCDSAPGSEPWDYWAASGAGWHMFILTGQALAYFVLTLVVDGGTTVSCARPKVSPPPHFHDKMVDKEAAYVERIIRLPKEQIPDSVLCCKVQKIYKILGFIPFFAVKDVSFSVKKGECFGLLGVTGSGKSAMFKMLTGETNTTSGTIFVNGHFASDRKNEYIRTLSYCPQSAGADAYQTGRQNLRLLLTLRGLNAADVTAVTFFWLEQVGLTVYADKRVSFYSGGCVRRLAVASAMCQNVPTTLLDEPTAGVDPVARRHMHIALLRARQQRSLIIGSHSLDEVEALCHRIAIMAGGELCVLGSPAELKAHHGQGYSVVFKLSAQKNADNNFLLDEFKGRMTTQFKSELLGEYQYTLSYRVNDSVLYSEIFSRLEQLQDQFSELVEDYTVTETTLEEVFLALAKEARARRALSK